MLAEPTSRAPFADRVAAVLLQVFPRVLGAFFIWTGIHKIVSPDSIRPVLEFDGFPPALIQPTMFAVVAMEMALGLLLLAFRWKRSTVIVASIALLVVYSAQLGYLLANDAAPSCGCAQAVLPGADEAHRHNLMGLVRNILLLIPATWVWVQLLIMPTPAAGAGEVGLPSSTR
jgi:hypothetical protein